MSYWPGNTRNISSIFSCKSWKTTLLSSFLHWAESNVLCHEVGDRKRESRSFRLGTFPWDFLVSWLNIQEGKHGDEVIEASKTFSGRSCCCASLGLSVSPGAHKGWVKLSWQDTQPYMCLHTHTHNSKNKIMCMRKLHGWNRNDLNSVCPGSYTLFAFIKVCDWENCTHCVL